MRQHQFQGQSVRAGADPHARLDVYVQSMCREGSTEAFRSTAIRFDESHSISRCHEWFYP